VSRGHIFERAMVRKEGSSQVQKPTAIASARLMGHISSASMLL